MIEISIFLIGAIIVAGFLGNYLFERTKIPDVLLLMLLGVLLGPVLKIADPAFLTPLAPFFGALALVIILFDGGLNLNLFKVLGELAPATLFTLMTFVAAVIAVTAAASLSGWNFFHALLLGIILGGTASNFVIAVVARLSVSTEVKTLLSLESAINDTLTIVGAIALTGVIATNSVNLQSVSNSILGAFTIAAAAGAIVGLVWLKVMAHFHEKPFGYMLTLAMMFMLYAGVESVKANGAIAVLLFGLIMGSSKQLQRMLDGNQKPIEFEGSLRTFHSEISFFVRTFFFVYLGVILNLDQLTIGVLGISFLVFLAALFGRFLAVSAFASLARHTQPYRFLMTVMSPRGLAAAVLAGMPAAMGVIVPYLQETVFTALVLTNAMATVGIFYYERNRGKSSVPRESPSPRTSGIHRPKIVYRR
ncbi:cation:proton antiporter [Candidatus Micrarchaeota archaeon]|nr:cation:proton antiporter [Candidatus Micrarchaeota archaeon]